MDFQHRVGSKTGGGGVASSSESSRDRKERLRKLALETIDIQKARQHDMCQDNMDNDAAAVSIGSVFYEESFGAV